MGEPMKQLKIFPFFKMEVIHNWTLEGRRYAHVYATGYSPVKLDRAEAFRFLKQEFDRDKRTNFLWDCLDYQVNVKRGRK
jgi:hypothetical protein